jgi:hypothetical protein
MHCRNLKGAWEMKFYAAVGFVVLASASFAQEAAPPGPVSAAQRQMGADPTPAPIIFEEKWTRAPQAQPMTQANLGNQNLRLHLYGDVAGIRKTFHPVEDYTYTGETITNWALTVSDPASLWNLSGNGRVRLTTRNSGYRFTHIVLKTPDGSYFVSEEGSPESTSWIEREYILSDLHWRNLLMVDKPTNASNRRQPRPALTPIIPTSAATPDLTRIEEIGFSDLMPGGWIPATSRVKSWAVFGKKITR